MAHVIDWQDLFIKLVAGGGAIISTIFGLYLKSQSARIADKDKQIADLIQTNERFNLEKNALFQKLIDKINGG